jgi:hypothetical protein
MSRRLRQTIQKKDKRKSMKRKSMKRKSMKRKSMKRKSMKHKSMKHGVMSYHHKYLSGGAGDPDEKILMRIRAAAAAESRMSRPLEYEADSAAAEQTAAEQAEAEQAAAAEQAVLDAPEGGSADHTEVSLTGLDDTVEKLKCYDWLSTEDVEVDEYLKDEGNFIVLYQTREGEDPGTLYGLKLEPSRVFNRFKSPENPQHITLVAGTNIIVKKPDWFEKNEDGTNNVIPSPKLFKLVPIETSGNMNIYELELLSEDGPEYKEIFSEACKGAKVAVKEAISEVLEEKKSGRKPEPSIVKKLVAAKDEYQRECGRRWLADIKNEEKKHLQRKEKVARKAKHDKKVEQDLKIRELVDIGKRLCPSGDRGILRGSRKRSDRIFKFLTGRESFSELIRKMGVEQSTGDRGILDVLEQIKVLLLILVNDEEIKRAIVWINSSDNEEALKGYLDLLKNLREKIHSGEKIPSGEWLLIKLYKEIKKELTSFIKQIDRGAAPDVLEQLPQMIALFNKFMVNLGDDTRITGIIENIYILLYEIYIKHLRDSTPSQPDRGGILDKAILYFINHLNPKIKDLLRTIEAKISYNLGRERYHRWKYGQKFREGCAYNLKFYYEKLAEIAPDYEDKHNNGKTYKEVWDSINNEKRLFGWRSSRLRDAFQTLPDPTKFLK